MLTFTLLVQGETGYRSNNDLVDSLSRHFQSFKSRRNLKKKENPRTLDSLHGNVQNMGIYFMVTLHIVALHLESLNIP